VHLSEVLVSLEPAEYYHAVFKRRRDSPEPEGYDSGPDMELCNDTSPVFQGLRDNALYRPGAEYTAPGSQNVILLVLSKIRYWCSNVWENLRNFAQLQHRRLVPIVVIR
jgi:hypothetical protein